MYEYLDVLTPRARALAGELRASRKNAELTGRELGRKLGLSHSVVSHWETGRRIPTQVEVASVLTATGVVGAEKDRVLDLARHAAEPNWLTAGSTGIPHQMAGAIECERSARAITEWAATGLPGLLQTPEYTRSIMLASGLRAPEVDDRVMLRFGRREILTRRDPVEFEALIGEAALRDAIGDAVVMRAQLCFLLEMAARPNVRIRVMPSRSGWHPGHSGPFILYDFPHYRPVLYFEHYSSGAFVPDDYDVGKYRTAIDTMRGVAMSPEDSAAFIAGIVEEHRDDVAGDAGTEVAQVEP